MTRVVTKDETETVLTEWRDDLVTRATAIDRLEGLATGRPSEAPRIARMLSVYLRELSREHPAQPAPTGVTIEGLTEWAKGLKPVRSDMEKAAQALGRIRLISQLAPDDVTIDLRDTNLQGFDLARLNLEMARLSGARMESANLEAAQMQGADLENARLSAANLIWARMEGANLSWARLEGVDLSRARLNSTNFTGAHLDGAKVVDADLAGANFWLAELKGADLFQARIDTSTDFDGSNLKWVRLGMVDLSQSRPSIGQFASAFGDASVILPGGVTPGHPDWPAHWPVWKLDFFDYDEQYTLWRANPATYTPPPPPP